MKVCTVCRRSLPLEMFYVNRRMLDGHLNQCRDCHGAQQKAYRTKHIERIRYEGRNRPNKKEQARRSARANKIRRLLHPEVNDAQRAVAKAVIQGKVKREDACGQCSSTFAIHAHHDDYGKPLEVRWLCAVCHFAYHRLQRKAIV